MDTTEVKVSVSTKAVTDTLEEAGLSITHEEAERLGVHGVMEKIKEAYEKTGKI